MLTETEKEVRSLQVREAKTTRKVNKTMDYSNNRVVIELRNVKREFLVGEEIVQIGLREWTEG